MELIKALILGIVQGLTEFLPVSSSGHIEIAKVILGDQFSAEEGLMMTIVLHFATAISTVIVFKDEIKSIFQRLFKLEKESKDFAFNIFISMLPAGLVGLFFQDELKALFDGQIVLVGICLIITGILLFIADRAKPTSKKLSWSNALIIGIAQAVALLPGISRSGSTIATSVLLGNDKEKSTQFSFLMVLPLIFLKMGKDSIEMKFSTLSPEMLSYMGVGFVSALLTGIIACKLMIKIVKNGKLYFFSIYCWIVGTFAIIYGWR